MKNILVVTKKFPFPLFRGDNLRIYNISKHLSKKNNVDLIYTGLNENFQKQIKFFNKVISIKTNKIKKIFFILYFLIKGKPFRISYFFSLEMRKKIEKRYVGFFIYHFSFSMYSGIHRVVYGYKWFN